MIPLLITTTITHTHTHTPLSVVGPGRLQWTFSEFISPASLKAVDGQPLGSRLILSEHGNIFKEGRTEERLLENRLLNHLAFKFNFCLHICNNLA